MVGALVRLLEDRPRLVLRGVTTGHRLLGKQLRTTLDPGLVRRLAHWTTFLASVASERPLMHPWSPPGHRQRRSIFEVQREFCGVRWPRTLGPATGLCASERRSVSDRRRGPGTTGWLPTAATARNPLGVWIGRAHVRTPGTNAQ